MGISEVVDGALDIEIEAMTRLVLSKASNFSTKDLYGYGRRVSKEAYYKVLSECVAIIAVFELDEFSVDQFNMATTKHGQPRLLASIGRTARGEEDEGLLEGAESEEDSGAEAEDDVASEGVTLLARVMSLVTNVIISLVLSIGAIMALDMAMSNYNKQYNPVIIGTIVLLVSAITVISWHSAELSYIRNESYRRKISRRGDDNDG